MQLVRTAPLYAAIALCANVAMTGAASADPAALEALRVGDMEKLVLSAPKPVPAAVLLDISDGEHALTDYAGRVVLVNFWATWCAPCREEMPSLGRLEAELGGADFAEVPVATGRNAPQAITKFLEEAGIDNLPILRDPKQQLARDLGILGLPMTVILNRQGQEVGRLIGTAEWDGPAAKAMLAALIAE